MKFLTWLRVGDVFSTLDSDACELLANQLHHMSLRYLALSSISSDDLLLICSVLKETSIKALRIDMSSFSCTVLYAICSHIKLSMVDSLVFMGNDYESGCLAESLSLMMGHVNLRHLSVRQNRTTEVGVIKLVNACSLLPVGRLNWYEIQHRKEFAAMLKALKSVSLKLTFDDFNA
jgi:hypothetical protein